MPRLPHLLALLATALVLALGIAACGDDEEDEGTDTAAATQTTAAEPECDKETLSLVNAGTLTIGTDKPAFPPYFEDDDPTNGKGFESAVAYAIAEELDFAKTEVDWIVVPFNSSFAPGPKKFDFDINQISITPKRAERVDFSEPYFTTPQAVLTREGSEIADATSFAELKDAKFGVQVGTTSLDALNEQIQPNNDAQVFNDSNDTVRALKDGRVDAIVVDLPTALYLAAAELDDGKIVGQFEAPGGDDWGVVLAKDSELTPCVDEAIVDLREDGVLDQLQEQYMGSDTAPELS